MDRDAERFAVTVPLPPRAVSPNARSGHWGPGARAAAEARRTAALAALATLQERGLDPPRWSVVRVTYCWQARRKPVPDPDNIIARAKPCLDGLVDAGILADDRWVRTIEVVRATGPDQLTIVVERLRDDEELSPLLGALRDEERAAFFAAERRVQDLERLLARWPALSFPERLFAVVVVQQVLADFRADVWFHGSDAMRTARQVLTRRILRAIRDVFDRNGSGSATPGVEDDGGR